MPITLRGYVQSSKLDIALVGVDYLEEDLQGRNVVLLGKGS